MKALVIYNPVAGGGRERLLQRFVAALEARQVTVLVYRTRGPGDATRWLAQRGVGEDIVIAVGGDGTTNEVINGLPAGVPLGVFATGTANVLARELELPSAPEQAAEIIASGEDLTIWPARIGGRRFVMMAGLGYDAWVVNEVNLGLKSLVGKGAYVWSMLRQLMRYGSHEYRLELDGREHRCYSAIITNGRYYGGSFLLSRRADISEPSLQVLMFRQPGLGPLLRCLLALVFGRMEMVPGVESVAARRVRLAGPAGEPLQTDGDPAGSLPAEISVDVQPLAVRVSSGRAAQAGRSRNAA